MTGAEVSWIATAAGPPRDDNQRYSSLVFALMILIHLRRAYGGQEFSTF